VKFAIAIYAARQLQPGLIARPAMFGAGWSQEAIKMLTVIDIIVALLFAAALYLCFKAGRVKNHKMLSPIQIKKGNKKNE
jgi:hypothetical protein